MPLLLRQFSDFLGTSFLLSVFSSDMAVQWVLEFGERGHCFARSDSLLLDNIFGHPAESGQDMSNRVVLAHMVQVEAGEVDRLIEVANDLHVLELGDYWVLEALFEQVVVSLLQSALALSS